MDLHHLTAPQLRARRTMKWTTYPDDVLPMWVAEMDYPLAQPIRRALVDAVEREMTGYQSQLVIREYAEAMVDWQAAQAIVGGYEWKVEVADVFTVPDVMKGVDLAIRFFSSPEDPVVIPMPVYMPFFDVVALTGRPQMPVPMAWDGTRHTFDVAAIDAALAAGGRTVLISSPHNPLGRVFTREELAGLAEVVERHSARVISDEIHAPLVFDRPHIPYAAVSPTAAGHSITVVSASKAWNVPGLKAAQVITTAPGDRERWAAIPYWERLGMTTFGMQAGIAAYREGGEWLAAVLETLAAHRTLVVDAVGSMPGVRTIANEGTYLQWLDFTELALDEEPNEWLLREAKVALNPGVPFGAAPHTHARLNFGTTTALLEQGLEQIAATVARHTRAGAGG